MRTKYESLRKKYSKAKILITGHSVIKIYLYLKIFFQLGAALAELLALDLASHFSIKIDYVYSFESPRLGNQEFAEYYAKKISNSYRIVHEYDIVPHLPLQKMGFQHINNEIWYNEDCSSYKECKGAEGNECSNSVDWKCNSVPDHLNIFN